MIYIDKKNFQRRKLRPLHLTTTSCLKPNSRSSWTIPFLGYDVLGQLIPLNGSSDGPLKCHVTTTPIIDR